jgi:hypothetical protein
VLLRRIGLNVAQSGIFLKRQALGSSKKYPIDNKESEIEVILDKRREYLNRLKIS